MNCILMYFVICKPVTLGFFNGREQYDRLIGPGQGHLEFDGSDIYWIFEGQRWMSDTVNWAVTMWVRDGSIKESLARPTSG